MAKPILRPILRSILKTSLNGDSSGGGVPASVGSFYFPMGGVELNRYALNTGTVVTLTTPVSLAIGDTVEFTYDAINLMNTGKNLIESTAQTEYLRTGPGAHGDAVLSGFTCTMNGLAVTAGDDIIDSDYAQFGAEANKPVRIILTATTATDISSPGGSGDMNVPIYDLKITTVAQTYNWPMQTFNTALQPESDSDPIDVELITHSLSKWITWPFIYDEGDNLNDLVLLGNLFGGQNISVDTSLRDDGAANCTNFSSSTAERYTAIGDLSIAYSGGITIELIVKYQASLDRGTTDGEACTVLQTINNTSANSLWCLRFDNFHDPSDVDIYPCFTLSLRFVKYDRATQDYANNQGDVRSSTAAVVGQTYHMLATFRPSDDTMELWVDGVSVGTDSINPAFWSSGANDLLDGSAPTNLLFGPAYMDGGFLPGPSCQMQDVRIHKLEADQAFATQQYNGNKPA